MRIGPLDEPRVTQLVADATSIAPTPALIDALGDASGNPMMTLGFLQSFADGRTLMVRNGLLDVQGIPPASVPYDVRELLLGSVRRLDAEAESALVRIALLGNGLDLETLRLATGWSDETLASVLEAGEEVDLLRVVSDRVIFTHELLRWSLTQSVVGAARRRSSRSSRTRLQMHTDEEDPNRVALLAEQLGLSGARDVEARVGYWSELAGDHCLGQGAPGAKPFATTTRQRSTHDTDEARVDLKVKAGVACSTITTCRERGERLLAALHELDCSIASRSTAPPHSSSLRRAHAQRRPGAVRRTAGGPDQVRRYRRGGLGS